MLCHNMWVLHNRWQFCNNLYTNQLQAAAENQLSAEIMSLAKTAVTQEPVGVPQPVDVLKQPVHLKATAENQLRAEQMMMTEAAVSQTVEVSQYMGAQQQPVLHSRESTSCRAEDIVRSSCDTTCGCSTT